MTEKLIHVNAYTRSDGTSVKEHYRNVDSKAIIDDTGYLLQDILEKVQKFLENSGETFSSDDLTQTLEEMLGVQNISTQFEENLLEALSQAKTQREYSPLYNAYMRQRDMNKTTENALQHLKYAIDNGDYNAIVSGLEEYNKVQKENQNNIKPLENIDIKPIIPTTEDCSLKPALTPKVDWNEAKRSVLKNKSDMQKAMIGGGMNIYASINAPTARHLWQIATDDEKGYSKFVEQNGYFVGSIEDLPYDFKDYVHQKVKQQFGVDDIRGLILKPHSMISKELAKDSKLKDFISEHIQELLQGKKVSGSKCFNSNEDLKYSINNADILDMYINKNGDIVTFVFDTYDFNKNDPNWMVEWAYNVQINGLLNGFYTLILVVIPKEEWLMGL